MESSTIFIIGGVVLLAILFLIAKMAVRWAIRLLIVGIIIIALLGGGGFWWWTNSLSPAPTQNKPRPAPTRRATNN